MLVTVSICVEPISVHGSINMEEISNFLSFLSVVTALGLIVVW